MKEVYPQWWGASESAIASVNVSAFQFMFICMNLSKNVTNDGGVGSIYTGSTPQAFIPNGTYQINDEINLVSAYPYIVGESKDGVKIVQIDNNKRIFYQVSDLYRAYIKNINFIGGTKQLDLRNSDIDVGRIDIVYCMFQHNVSPNFAIYLSRTSGSDFIDGCTFYGCDRVIYVKDDKITISRCWIAGMNYDGSIIENKSIMTIRDTMLSGDATSLNARWIDNYNSLVADNTRFGSDPKGRPVVYNYADLTDYSPYSNDTRIVLTNCQITDGAALTYNAPIVLFTNIPSYINVSGGAYHTRPALIEDAIVGGVDSWISGKVAAGKVVRIIIDVDSIMDFGDAVVAIPSSLIPFTRFTNSSVIGTSHTHNSIISKSLYGYSYTQTSAGVGESIVDTDIVIPVFGGIYLGAVMGNSNSGGSGDCRESILGAITINIGIAGPGLVKMYISWTDIINIIAVGVPDLVVTAHFYNSSTMTEASDIDFADAVNNIIRIKISGYIGIIGAYQNIKLINLM